MNRRSFLQASAVGGISCCLAARLPDCNPPHSPREESRKKLLFWDLARFDYWDNVELVQGKGLYRPEATYTDPDLRKGRVVFPSVWQDVATGRWRAVYSTAWSPFSLFTLQSDNGMDWKPQPHPDIMPAGGKRAPNHVFTLERGIGCGIYHDPVAEDGYPLKIFGRLEREAVFQRALKDPRHVWHTIAKTEGLKPYMNEAVTLASRDGVHWAIKPDGNWGRPDWFPEDPVFAFYNRHTQQHVMTVRPGWGDRRVCWRETKDLKSWSTPELLFQPDPLDDQAPLGFYCLPVFPYEQGYVGLLWVFHYSNSEPVKSFNQFYGPMDVQLAFSYDGKRFFRGKREPFLARNPLPEHGCAQLRPTSLIVTDKEIRIYSEAHRAGHGRENQSRGLYDGPISSMTLHTLRHDSFMFVRSRGDWARLLSKPFALRSSNLTASIDARFGEARFQITSLKSDPIAGLTFDDCEPIRGIDEIEAPIRWKTAELDKWIGKPLRLEIKFYNANLYGLKSAWRFLDAQGAMMLEDGKSIDHLLFDF
jgi:hypothetical protein